MANFAILTMAFACLAELVVANPKVVPMKFGRLHPRKAAQKRDLSPVTLGNAVGYGLYYVNASVGTPGQAVALQIDTGSSDVWVFSSGACSDPSQCFGGTFDPSSSSSLTLVDKGGFSIQYVTPGSGVEGDYIADDFSIGALAIRNLTMAVATEAAEVFTGIMGIGFDTDEAAATPYPSIIDDMVTQGLIKSKSYSLYLDDLSDATGTVLFGGYDTEKFRGELTLLDIQPDAQSGAITSMTVAWTGLTLTDSSGTTSVSSESFPLPAVLDSGTTLIAVPSPVFDQLSTYFDAVEADTDYFLVQCSIGDKQGSLEFQFGGTSGPTISVAFREMAVPQFDNNGQPLTFDDGSPACQLGVYASPDGVSILLGDTFLRSAYVVYDLDAQQIGIAQTNFESAGSNIVEIDGSGGAFLTGVATATGVTVSQTATGVLPPGNSPTVTGSAVTSPSGPASSAGGVGSVTGVTTNPSVSTVSVSGATTEQVTGAATTGQATGGATTEQATGVATTGQATGSSTGSGSPGTTSIAIAAGVAGPAPLEVLGLLSVCWTAAALVVAGTAFSVLF